MLLWNVSFLTLHCYPQFFVMTIGFSRGTQHNWIVLQPRSKSVESTEPTETPSPVVESKSRKKRHLLLPSKCPKNVPWRRLLRTLRNSSMSEISKRTPTSSIYLPRFEARNLPVTLLRPRRSILNSLQCWRGFVPLNLSRAELVILTVNTFVKDTEDSVIIIPWGVYMQKKSSTTSVTKALWSLSLNWF